MNKDANSLFTQESETTGPTEIMPTSSDHNGTEHGPHDDGVNSTMFVTPLNVTEHQGFLHGFVESLSVILVSVGGAGERANIV